MQGIESIPPTFDFSSVSILLVCSGGIKLELLDEAGKLLQNLTAGDGGSKGDGKTYRGAGSKVHNRRTLTGGDVRGVSQARAKGRAQRGRRTA